MPSSRALHVVDVVLAIWVAAWIGLGIAIGIEVRDLTRLSHTVVVDGRAVQTVGRSLNSLGSIPLVGAEIVREGRSVQQAGASAVSGGHSSGSAVRTLSVLLAIAVALLPSVPVFGFYLPMRLARRREARALREALRRHAHDPAFQAFLAARALEAIGYDRLRRIAAEPWRDPANNARALAAAELNRLGVDPRILDRPEGPLR